jgi:hypothetical protein
VDGQDGISRDDFAALESFVVENEDLERLEILADRFNLFEAIGAVRQELRHSDFLAFLMDPTQSHGLGDLFATRLLQRALRSASSAASAVRPLDLELWSLAGLQIHREWRNIDVLLVDDTNRLVVLIENKIDSAEHSNQLGRYWSVVAAEYPGYRTVGLFLTPDGVPPSDERFIPIGYEIVCSLVEEIVERRASSVGAEVGMLLSHYAQMLRRHIVSDAEIAALCRRIYARHRRALDLIFEHRPDLQAEIGGFLERMIVATPGLLLDGSSKAFIRFLPQAWDVPQLYGGSGWTRTGRMLLFEFVNEAERLRLVLWVGPGPEEVRTRLFQLALAHQPPFKPSSRVLRRKWNGLYGETVLRPAAYADAALDDLTPEIEKYWEHFLSQDLPAITKWVLEEVSRWPQSPAEATGSATSGSPGSP